MNEMEKLLFETQIIGSKVKLVIALSSQDKHWCFLHGHEWVTTLL